MAITWLGQWAAPHRLDAMADFGAEHLAAAQRCCIGPAECLAEEIRRGQRRLAAQKLRIVEGKIMSGKLAICPTFSEQTPMRKAHERG